MLRFNANLFRIVNGFSSKEETRYYLNGVYVTPHAAGGVVLVATDGHRLFAVHDESGRADESAIIRLSSDALKACKPGRGERRDVVVYTGENKANVCVTIEAEEKGNKTLTDSPVAIAHDCRVDGSFPDWRRVVPSGLMVLEADAQPGHFNGAYLGAFGTAAGDLEKHFERDLKVGHMRVLCRDGGSPALIRFDKVPEAFGVLMPLRKCATDTASIRLPTWFDTIEAAPAVPVLEAAE